MKFYVSVKVKKGSILEWKNINRPQAVLNSIDNDTDIPFYFNNVPSGFRLNNKRYSNREQQSLYQEIKKLAHDGVLVECNTNLFGDYLHFTYIYIHIFQRKIII